VALVICGLVAIPIAAAVAILRYRLYAIDRLINRTLVYGLLTALLGGVYAGAVLLGGQLFGGVGDKPPSWAVAGATLAVAAVFQPARRRIQSGVDRRFNRHRYDAARTVEAFSVRLRDHLELDALTSELLAVVSQTVEPRAVSLWLRPQDDRPKQPAVAGANHRDTRPRVRLALDPIGRGMSPRACWLPGSPTRIVVQPARDAQPSARMPGTPLPRRSDGAALRAFDGPSAWVCVRTISRPWATVSAPASGPWP
jgi:hypothetical protein